MIDLSVELPPEHSMALALDTRSMATAEEWLIAYKNAGGLIAKMGLELETANSVEACSELAGDHGMIWVSDSKLHDIPNTTAGAMETYAELTHKPIAITIHTKSGRESLRAAQKIAGPAGITMLGVTHLTSTGEEETLEYEKAASSVVVWRESRRAVAGCVGGLVCAGNEVDLVKRFRKTNGLFLMVPGTRSQGVEAGDQSRVVTPYEAIRLGAELLVIGREITLAENPSAAQANVVRQIEEGRRDRIIRRAESRRAA